MGRIAEQLRAVGARRAALFVMITAAVAVGFYFGVREVGVRPPTQAGIAALEELPTETSLAGVSGDAEEPTAGALTLVLSAPADCQVDRIEQEIHASYRSNEDGVSEEIRELGHWADVATVAVTWRVSGGTEPYTLVIDGETQDVSGEYRGAAGTALVSCALDNGETYFSDRWGTVQRWHSTKPTVDSGVKTISATVIDAHGVEETATVEVRITRVLNVSSSLIELQGGKTYRVFGLLFTVPDGYDLRTGEIATPEGGPSTLTLHLNGADALIVIDLETGEEVGRYAAESSQSPSPDGTVDLTLAVIHAFFDEFLASRGRKPGASTP